ncbi:MAG: sigma-E processing peptidase SpoIIGA [Clostridia bacterium]|nr:sigma-E processing peptidase SpoIIGA [Clostridia bacterium]
MQVYIELAVLENFCIDFTLLYAAKLASKNPAHILRIVLGAAIGAAVAVTLPLIDLGTAVSVIFKILSGLLICLAAGKFQSFKSYLKFTGVFIALTALLGGALIAVFSLAGVEYSAGSGYILSSVPIGIPLFGALLIIIFARRLAAKLTKRGKTTVTCRIYVGDEHTEIEGFFDSGNKVSRLGQPVSVIPEYAAKKICDISGIKENVKIHTVAGSRNMKVFTADRVEIISDGEPVVKKDVKIGVSPHKINCAVLHCDLLET